MLTAVSHIIKIEQKLHHCAYIQVHSGNVQLDSGIAVPYPQFGDVVTSIQSTCSVLGTGSIVRKDTMSKLYSAGLTEPIFLHRPKCPCTFAHAETYSMLYDPSSTWP